GFIKGQEMIRGRVAQRIEELPAAARMAPTLGIHALGIGAHVQKFRPRLIVELRGLMRTCQVRLTAMVEFDFWAFTAVGADNEQHWKSGSVGDGGGRGLVDQVSVTEAIDGERRVDRMRLVPCN